MLFLQKESDRCKRIRVGTSCSLLFFVYSLYPPRRMLLLSCFCVFTSKRVSFYCCLDNFGIISLVVYNTKGLRKPSRRKNCLDTIVRRNTNSFRSFVPHEGTIRRFRAVGFRKILTYHHLLFHKIGLPLPSCKGC